MSAKTADNAILVTTIPEEQKEKNVVGARLNTDDDVGE